MNQEMTVAERFWASLLAKAVKKRPTAKAIQQAKEQRDVAVAATQAISAVVS